MDNQQNSTINQLITIYCNPYKIYIKIKKRGECMANKIIEVQNVKINIVNTNDNDYICISDFTKFKDGKSTSDDIIEIG